MTDRIRIIATGFSLQAQSRERGIPSYQTELFSLLARRPGVEIALRANSALPPVSKASPVAPLFRTDNQILAVCDADPIPTIHVLGEPFPPVYSGSRAYPEWLRARRPGTLAIVYDIIPWLYPDIYLPTEGKRRLFRSRMALLSTMDHVVTISASAATDLLTHFGFDSDKVSTIGTGVDLSMFSPGQADPSGDHVPANREMVLCVAGYEPRKNVARLIEAWAALDETVRSRHRLVIVCNLPPEGRKEWRALADGAGLSPNDYSFTGHVAEDTIVNLYRAAKLVVMPSLYEGYGLPIAEAAATGAPVICSDTSAMPEILSEPAGTFDPTSSEAIASAMQACLTDDALLVRLRDASRAAAPCLGWDPVVDRFLDVARRHARILRPVDSIRHVTVLSPGEPALSGVAKFTEQTVRELSRRCEVQFFADHRRSDLHGSIARGRRPAGALDYWESTRPGSEVIAVLGNSEFHCSALRYALTNRCHLWLHDVSLDGLVMEMAESLPRRDQRAALLNVLHDPAHVWPRWTRRNARNYRDRAMLREHGMDFLGPVVRGAKTVIVNTEIARQFVLATGQIEPRNVTVIPLGFTAPSATADRDPSPTIVSLGIVGATKQPETAIRAVARLDQVVRLVFAGPADDAAYRKNLEDLAEREGIADRVTFTGALSNGDYWAWCHRAWIGLQLRQYDQGEASGAVCDLLSAGTPVVSGVASSAELPEQSRLMVGRAAGVEEVADALQKLLGSDELRSRMSQAGLDHASRWTHAHVAESVERWIFGAADAAVSAS